MAELTIEGPCVRLPELPELPTITLFGATLTGHLDFSMGMPSDCSANMSLMAQVAPLLASLAPLLKILKVLQALKSAAESAFLDAGDLLSALADLAGLFAAMTPAGIAITVKGILEVIISFMLCFITQLRSVLEFQANISGIETAIAADASLDSPVLRASLSCANANAELAMGSVMGSLGPIQPLLDMVGMIGGVVGLSLDLSLDMSAAGDVEAMIVSLEQTITKVRDVIQSLPS
jgi:hypothetical protein